MPPKRGREPAKRSSARRAAAPTWARDSTIRTPGRVGCPGKCPAKKSSFPVRCHRPLAPVPGWMSTISSTRRKGGRWGSRSPGCMGATIARRVGNRPRAVPPSGTPCALGARRPAPAGGPRRLGRLPLRGGGGLLGGGGLGGGGGLVSGGGLPACLLPGRGLPCPLPRRGLPRLLPGRGRPTGLRPGGPGLLARLPGCPGSPGLRDGLPACPRRPAGGTLRALLLSGGRPGPPGGPLAGRWRALPRRRRLAPAFPASRLGLCWRLPAGSPLGRGLLGGGPARLLLPPRLLGSALRRLRPRRLGSGPAGPLGLLLLGAAGDLGLHRLLARRPGDLGELGKGQLDAPPLGVQGLEHEPAVLALAQHRPGLGRRRVPQAGQGHVPPGPVHGDERPVGGEALHLALHLAAEGVLGDEGDERKGLVHGLGWWSGSSPAAPATGRGRVGSLHLLGGRRNGLAHLLVLGRGGLDPH